MTARERAGRTEPPLLLLVNTSAASDAAVRSGVRRVLHWSAAGAGVAGDRFRGDLTSPATYAVAQYAEAVTAVFELPDEKLALAALAALRAVRPDAAVLLLSDTLADAPGDGTLARSGSLRDVLRLDLEEELQRLETERRVYCLRQFVHGAGVVPILLHPDPDPDALGCALALRVVLGRAPEASPVVALGETRRPENRRLAEVLKLEVRVVDAAELAGLERLLVVDMQPAGLFADGGPRLGVIDHHPAEQGYDAEFLDLRPEYGAASSMLTEYLRASCESAVDPPVATALLHGIKTDTDLLTRGVSPEDVQAYAFLQERSDPELLRRFERPSLSLAAARLYGAALTRVQVAEGTASAHAGGLEEDSAHLLAELADFLLTLDGARLAVATGYVKDDLVLTFRSVGGEGVDAGELARKLVAEGGSGGGHPTMARAVLPRAIADARVGSGDAERMSIAVLDYVARLVGGELTRRS